MESRFFVFKLNGKNVGRFITAVLGPPLLGILASLFIDASLYDAVKMPASAPSRGVLFAVTGILHVTSGFAAYTVGQITRSANLKRPDVSLLYYYVSLLLNILWPFVFFNAELHLLSVAWLLLTAAVSLCAVVKFLAIDRKSGFLALPSVLWSLYLAYFSLRVFIISF